MPLPLAPLFGFAVGALFALAARAELIHHDGGLAGTRGFALSAAYGLLVLAPATGYFAAFHGDWAYLYLVPSARVPSALELVAVLAIGATVPAGFALGAALSRRARKARGAAALVVVGPLALLAGLVAVASRRLATSASYAQYHGHFGGERLAGSLLGRGVALMGLVVVAGVGWALREALSARDGRPV